MLGIPALKKGEEPDRLPSLLPFLTLLTSFRETPPHGKHPSIAAR
jgi:hypothetical protein